jgi:hypothetical protein
MTKAKRVYSPGRRLLVWVIKLGFAMMGCVICGLCSCTVAYSAYMSVGFIKPSLDAALLPTAQYLYEHPQPTPEGMSITLRYETSSPYSKVCYTYTQEREIYDPLQTTLYLNGAMVPRYETMFRCHSLLLTRDIIYHSGIDASKLDQGLHLVELHLRRWPWDTPYVYQAAVLIED